MEDTFRAEQSRGLLVLTLSNAGRTGLDLVNVQYNPAASFHFMTVVRMYPNDMEVHVCGRERYSSLPYVLLADGSRAFADICISTSCLSKYLVLATRSQ